MIIDITLVVGGLVLLILGGESLVRGASSLAERAGISPLVIGLVVVSASTSAPEFAVSLGAVLRGEPDLAVGNVVGSNIFNVLFILGLSALVAPLVIKRQLVRFDIPFMLFISVLLMFLALDGAVSLNDGFLLLGALFIHTVISIVMGRRESNTVDKGEEKSKESSQESSRQLSALRAVLFLLAGIGLLVAGAQLLVSGAVSIASALGVSSLVIGLTVVAAGTSLPEVATSLIAMRKGETDIAVGNVVGSNIFNIGMVLGLPAIIFGSGIPVTNALIAIDIPLMIATAIALLPIAFTGFVVARWEGFLFFGMYVTYTLYLVLASTEHDAAQGFTTIMLWFVMPLIAATLVAITAYEFGLQKGKKLGVHSKRESG